MRFDPGCLGVLGGSTLPQPTTFLNVGGFQIDEKNPVEMGAGIERFIMGADHGVIFFSLGSTFNTDVPDPGYIEGFIEMLSRAVIQ